MFNITNRVLYLRNLIFNPQKIHLGEAMISKYMYRNIFIDTRTRKFLNNKLTLSFSNLTVAKWLWPCDGWDPLSNCKLIIWSLSAKKLTCLLGRYLVCFPPPKIDFGLDGSSRLLIQDTYGVRLLWRLWNSFICRVHTQDGGGGGIGPLEKNMGSSLLSIGTWTIKTTWKCKIK